MTKWYEKALRGKYANELGDEVLKNLQVEIMEEFPPTKDLPKMLTDRHYEKVSIQSDGIFVVK